jgi:hypothetical protein
MMAAPSSVTRAALAPGAPMVLFHKRIVGGGEDVTLVRRYDVAPDGRFLIKVLNRDAAPITLLQNWSACGVSRDRFTDIRICGGMLFGVPTGLTLLSMLQFSPCCSLFVRKPANWLKNCRTQPRSRCS